MSDKVKELEICGWHCGWCRLPPGHKEPHRGPSLKEVIKEKALLPSPPQEPKGGK